MDFRNQNAFNVAVEPESQLLEKTTCFVNLTEGLLMTEAGIRPSADSDCNELRAAATGQRIVRMFAVIF